MSSTTSKCSNSSTQGLTRTSGGQVLEFTTEHDENINDCEFDFYGTQLASCDSKGFLQISTLKNGA